MGPRTRVGLLGPNGVGKSTLPKALAGDVRGPHRLRGADARTLLAKLDLAAEDVIRPCQELSPGERTRANLATLMARRVNCLILDEPTNHLDIRAIEELERSLAAYPGAFLLATHDRRLLERVGFTRSIEL